MVTDVERIGDQASDIAELVLHLHAKSTDAVGVLEDILKMGDDVLKMVKRLHCCLCAGGPCRCRGK